MTGDPKRTARYIDDLSARQERIRELEKELAELRALPAQDPHAEMRKKLLADAAELRRYGDDLWVRDKKERSSHCHDEASKLEELAREPDLAEAIAKRDAEAKRQYDALVAIGALKPLK